MIHDITTLLQRNVIESDDDDEDEAAAIEDSKPVIDEPAVATVPAREPTAGQLLTQQASSDIQSRLLDIQSRLLLFTIHPHA